MKPRWWLIVLGACLPGAALAADSLAVLALDAPRADEATVSALTDAVQSGAKASVGARLSVWGREAIAARVSAEQLPTLAGGSIPAIGKALGATYVLSGALRSVDDEQVLSLELHAVRGAELLGSGQWRAAKSGGLLDVVGREVGRSVSAWLGFGGVVVRTPAGLPEGASGIVPVKPGDRRASVSRDEHGWVVTASGSWTATGGAVDQRRARRAAIVRAELAAKAQLAKAMQGSAVVTVTKVEVERTAVGDVESTVESLSENVDGLVRGASLREVAEETGARRVWVTLEASKEAAASGERRPGGVVEAASVDAGLDRLLAEVRSGFVAPVGSRVVSGPGGLAFVGYGSAAVERGGPVDKVAMARVKAEKIAQVRASAALCAALTGDRVRWLSKLDTETRLLVSEAEGSTADAGVADNVARIGTTERFAEQFESARQGRLPPGVSLETVWVDGDAEAVTVAWWRPE